MLQDIYNAKTKTTDRSSGCSLHEQHHLIVMDDLKRSIGTIETNLVDKLQHLFGILVFHLALGLEVIIRLIDVGRGKEHGGHSGIHFCHLVCQSDSSNNTEH